MFTFFNIYDKLNNNLKGENTVQTLNTYNFSERTLKKLSQLQLSNRILNTEANLYIYKTKDKWIKGIELIKIFYNNEPEFMKNKIFVLEQLMKKKEKLQMPELILPTALVSVDNKMVGYSMPWIMENVNLVLLLQNENVNLTAKMQYLKQIHTLLHDLKQKQKNEEHPLYLGDIHEANFLLNILTQKINVVDIDSVYLNGALAPTSKYLSYNPNLEPYITKYPIDARNNNPIPNHNTTVLSFIYMFLNTLSLDKSYRWSYEEFYTYLDFLYQEKVDQELLTMISSIYSNQNKLHFDAEYLDSLDCERNYVLNKRKK